MSNCYFNLLCLLDKTFFAKASGAFTIWGTGVTKGNSIKHFAEFY